MALPRAAEARRFYQAAKQRFEDGQLLLELDRTTGAVYLAGYGVECMLKALILSLITGRARSETVASFRSARAHEFEWLKAKYFEQGGAAFAKAVARQFSLVNTWATDLRYKPGTVKRDEAEAFFRAAEAIMVWADGRL
jgi:hypothetical protein